MSATNSLLWFKATVIHDALACNVKVINIIHVYEDLQLPIDAAVSLESIQFRICYSNCYNLIQIIFYHYTLQI